MQTHKVRKSNRNFISYEQSQRTGKIWLGKPLRFIAYLNGTKELVLTLSAYGMNNLKWFVRASYATQADTESHTAILMTMGEGSIISKSTKQKLNIKISS